MKHIAIIFKKQMKDTLYNKGILIQFVLFPLLSWILTSSVHDEGIPHDYFVKLFAGMYIAMAPIMACSSVISEEMESGALKMLRYSNVKAIEYLMGVGIYVLTFCMLGCLLMGITASFSFSETVFFLCISAVGVFISILIGSIIAMQTSSQMKAASWSIPVMTVFSFMPMICMFNETARKPGVVIYTQQIKEMMDVLSFKGFSFSSLTVLLGSLMLGLAIFMRVYKKALMRKS